MTKPREIAFHVVFPDEVSQLLDFRKIEHLSGKDIVLVICDSEDGSHSELLTQLGNIIEQVKSVFRFYNRNRKVVFLYSVIGQERFTVPNDRGSRRPLINI